jgi:hypothetical protein
MLCCTTLIFSMVFTRVISVYFLLLPKVLNCATFSLEKKLVTHWKFIKMYNISQIFSLESGKHAAVG